MSFWNLLEKFKRGVAYFNEELAISGPNPFLQKKMVEFEHWIIRPMDEAAKKLTRQERDLLKG